MGVEGGVRKTLSFVFAEEFAIAQADVIDFVARVAAVELMPRFAGRLSFPKIDYNSFSCVTESVAQVEGR